RNHRGSSGIQRAVYRPSEPALVPGRRADRVHLPRKREIDPTLRSLGAKNPQVPFRFLAYHVATRGGSVRGVSLGRSSLHTGWALVACAALAGCSPAPQPPAASLGSYQPASLSEAVIFGNRTAVENYLALGVDPNEPEPDGTTPLMRAVHGQHPELAELLIAA